MKLAWLVVVVVACNPDRGPKWRRTDATTPHAGGRLRIALKDSIKTLDPVISNDEITSTAVHPLFDTLVDFAPYGLTLVPRLASSWEPSADGLVYTFHLRSGIAYEDGRPIVAADFKFALERALSLPDACCVHTLDDVVGADKMIAGTATACDGITTPDDATLVIALAHRNVAFPQVMTMTMTAPQRRDWVAAAGTDIRRRPLASGPYRLESWDEGQRIVLVRNPHYHASDRGYIDRIEMLENVPRDVQFLMFERNELDTAERLTAPDYLWVTTEPSWRPFLHTRAVMNAYGSRMNVRVKPFDDVRVRRALNYALDKDHTTKLLTGTSVPSHGILPPGMVGRDDSIPPYPHDPARARALLAQAGYPGGFDVDYLTTNDDEQGKLAQSLQSDLAEVGVRVRISMVSLETWATVSNQPTGPAFSLAGWAADYPDPVSFLDAVFATRAIGAGDSINNTFYSNPALDQLLDRARAELDADARAAMYRRAERIIYDDAPWIWNYHQVVTEVTQPYVRDYEPHPVWLRDYTQTWLDLGPDGEPVAR